MNWNLNLIKLISLATLTTGLLIPTNIAEAAGSSSKSHSSPYKNEIVTDVHTDEHQEPAKISQIFLSEKAQKIEFFTVLGLIGCSLVLPEVLQKSKKKEENQPLKANKNQSNKALEPEKDNTELDMSYLENILNSTKELDFSENNLVDFDEHKKNSSKSQNSSERKIS